jgi:uncharacterized membrane protein (UPF0127 family)
MIDPMRSRQTLVVLGLLMLSACARSSAVTSSPSADHAVHFGSGEATLRVAVADTDDERARGLMGVADVPADEGMAFLFDRPTSASFWMKDTLIPLSVAFVDADGTIVTIRHMQPCTADPCVTYASTDPYVLAIEANEGWFGDHGVRVGDSAQLSEFDDG